MPSDLWSLYALMLKSRLFEEAIAKLWHDGLISGEMHLGTGEEAIIAGVVAHLRDGDAMALDHRGTSAWLMRGVDPVLLVREMLGYPDGLCGGMGGHMHLFSKEYLAASSGIVGAEGPAAAGFALAAQYSRPGAVARTGRLLVVDEDYEGFGLSGELSAVVLEAGISCKYARVCTQTTIPYARHLEDQSLPNKQRIYASVRRLMQ